MHTFIRKDDERISLHDCRATGAKYKHGRLAFFFEKGFWVSGADKGTPSNIMRTGPSEAVFSLESEDDITIYVFTKKKNGDIRKEMSLKKLIKKLNKGTHRLEFLYQYKDFGSRIIECWLWFGKKPYHKECEIKLTTKQVSYEWDELLP